MVLVVIAVPVALAWAATGVVLTWFGEPPELVADASYYAYVLAACIPARVAFSQLSQYLSAQRIMYPSVVVSGAIARRWWRAGSHKPRNVCNAFVNQSPGLWLHMEQTLCVFHLQ